MQSRAPLLSCVALFGIFVLLPLLLGLIPNHRAAVAANGGFVEEASAAPPPPSQRAAQPPPQRSAPAGGDAAVTSLAPVERFPLLPAPTLPEGGDALIPEYAKRLWQEALPLPPREPAVDLVISRCNEDPAWITTFAPQLARTCKLRVLVYEKCLPGRRGVISEQKSPFHLVKVALPNVGYEGHTFLHHLISESAFPDLVFFLQGHDPRVHMRQSNVPLLDYFSCIIHHPERYLRNGFRYVSDERWEFFTQEQACWEGYYQAIFQTTDCPPVLGTLCCSAFVVTKERIAAVPRGIFERAMRFMNGTVLPRKLRLPVNAEDRKAQKIFDTIRPQGFWSDLEANCKTPPGSRLGYCAGAVARYKVEGVQIEHLWQAMFGEPYWLPPNAFPLFEPRQLRSHLWKLKDAALKESIVHNFSRVFPNRYHPQIFSRTQMGLGMIETHLKQAPPPSIR